MWRLGSKDPSVRRAIYEACEQNCWYRASYDDPRLDSGDSRLKFKCDACGRWNLQRSLEADANDPDDFYVDEDDGRIWAVQFTCLHCHAHCPSTFEDVRYRGTDEPNCVVVLPDRDGAGTLADWLVANKVPVGGHALRSRHAAMRMLGRQRSRWHARDAASAGHGLGPKPARDPPAESS